MVGGLHLSILPRFMGASSHSPPLPTPMGPPPPDPDRFGLFPQDLVVLRRYSVAFLNHVLISILSAPANVQLVECVIMFLLTSVHSINWLLIMIVHATNWLLLPFVHATNWLLLTFMQPIGYS